MARVRDVILGNRELLRTLNIGENRNRPCVPNGIGRRHKCQGGQDYFVAGLQANCQAGQVQSRGRVGDRNRMWHAQELSKFLLEPLRLHAHA